MTNSQVPQQGPTVYTNGLKAESLLPRISRLLLSLRQIGGFRIDNETPLDPENPDRNGPFMPVDHVSADDWGRATETARRLLEFPGPSVQISFSGNRQGSSFPYFKATSAGGFVLDSALTKPTEENPTPWAPTEDEKPPLPEFNQGQEVPPNPLVDKLKAMGAAQRFMDYFFRLCEDPPTTQVLLHCLIETLAEEIALEPDFNKRSQILDHFFDRLNHRVAENEKQTESPN